MRWGYQNIKYTGLFNRECEKWRKKPPADKSWTAFRKHFNLAYDDYLKYEANPLTAADATYTANQVQQILHDELSTILGSTAPTDNPSTDISQPPVDSPPPASSTLLPMPLSPSMMSAVPYLNSILGKDEHVLVFSRLEAFTVKSDPIWVPI